MTVIQGALFAAVLAYASVIDIRTRTVPNRIHALLLLTGLLTVSLSSVLWALTLFSVFFIVALATDIGGGDVKLAGMCGFVLGKAAVPSLLAGLTAFVVFTVMYCIIRRKPIKGTSLPLVPFIAFGCLLFLMNWSG